VLPGITGLAQVCKRNTENWDLKLAWDVQYVDSICFREDMKILMMTLTQADKGGDSIGSLIEFRKSGKLVEPQLIKSH